MSRGTHTRSRVIHPRKGVTCWKWVTYARKGVVHVRKRWHTGNEVINTRMGVTYTGKEVTHTRVMAVEMLERA